MIFLNYLYAPHRNSFCSPSSADDNGVINLWLYLGDKAHVRMILQLPAHHATYSICYLNQNAFSCYQERLFWSGKKKKKMKSSQPSKPKDSQRGNKKGHFLCTGGVRLGVRGTESQSSSNRNTNTRFFLRSSKENKYKSTTYVSSTPV